jgi:hypothetical protein
MKRPSLPHSDGIESFAQFWDRHDLTDFEDELEEIKGPVFARSGRTSVIIDLPSREAKRAKRIAEAKGVEERAMLRQWILERIHEASLKVGSAKSGSRGGRPRTRRS